MLKARVVTALVLIPLLLGSILWLETPVFAVLLGGFTLIGSWEWSRLSGFTSLVSRLAYVGITAIAMWSFYDWLHAPETLRYLLYLVFMVWIFIFVWLTISPVEKMLSNAFNVYLRAFVGLALLLPCWLAVLALHLDDGRGVSLLISLLVLIWVADSGAYFTGKFMGITRLAPQISPGKTLEGVYGGLAATAIVSYLLALLLGFEGIARFQFIAIAMMVAVFSIVGDLFESVAKRTVAVKDSGQLFPGHGGVMDRIDSLTAAAPIYVLALGWFPHLAQA